MLINLRNAMMSGKKSPLPPGARWVEYLESTGTQYVNTGIVADSTTRILIGMAMPSVTSSAIPFGANGMQTNIGTPMSRQYFGSTTDAFAHNQISNGVRFDIDMNAPEKSVIINGTQKTISWTSSWSCSDAYPLFAFVSSGQVTYRTCKVFICMIWKNGVLVRDFIPVRKGTVGYLYDRVTGKMDEFGNAGTGDFIIGPDK